MQSFCSSTEANEIVLPEIMPSTLGRIDLEGDEGKLLRALLLALALVVILGKGLFNAMVAVGIVLIPTFARITRATVLGEKSRDYVLSARSIGVRSSRILWRHIVPNSLSPLIVAASFPAGLESPLGWGHGPGPPPDPPRERPRPIGEPRCFPLTESLTGELLP